MTTKTDITLPPLPEWSKMDDLGGLVPSEVRVALAGYARAAVEADRQGWMPSDEEINVAGMPEFDDLLDHIYEYGTASEGVLARADRFARALLSRYGQPAASAETHRCEDCPPVGYPTDKTRCAPCDRRAAPVAQEPVGVAVAMPGTSGGFTMATFRGADVSVGTKLYAAAANGEPFAHLVHGLLPVECPKGDTKDQYDAAYEAGWRNAASWAQRGDLVHDIGSPAYERERDAARNGS